MKTALPLLICLISIGLGCWKNAAPPPPGSILSPEQAIADFLLEPGFTAEIVAAEPMVQDPVAIAFDADAALWVVEMRGYMPDETGLDEDRPTGRIKILRDRDGDGRADEASIFLDSLVLPRAICPVYGGALVAEPPKLWFYEKIGDRAAGRTLVDSAYAEGGNPEHQPNGLLPALDNWIYSAKSDRRYRRIAGQWICEKTNFRGQWGIAQDDFGRLFFNDNSTTLRGDQLPPNRLPALAARFGEKAAQLAGCQLIDNRVYPRHATPGVNRGYENGVLDSTGRLLKATSVCGPTVYRGDNFPAQFSGNVFVPEPAAQLIKRIVLRDSAGLVRGQMPYREREFLTATDERFRPVNTATAPDGSLCIVDMHRGLIQHATYLTPFLREQVRARKLAEPTGLGRIFRIRRSDQKPAPCPALTAMTSAQLVDLLAHPNGWRRDKAQWLLVERADTSAAPSLENMAKMHPDPRARLHALWTLEGMGRLSPALLTAVFEQNNHAQVAAAALFLTKNWDAFAAMRRPDDVFLELQFAAAATRFCPADFEKARPVLLDLAEKFARDSLVAAALAGGFWENCSAEQRKVLKKDCQKWGIARASCLMQWLENQPKAPASAPPGVAHLTKSEREFFAEGANSYATFCAGCHGKSGEGVDGLAPPLAGSEWVTTADKNVPIRVLLDGLSGPITVAGKRYDLPAAMPGLRENQAINDGTMAKILTFVRNSWGNQATAVHLDEVTRARAYGY